MRLGGGKSTRGTGKYPLHLTERIHDFLLWEEKPKQVGKTERDLSKRLGFCTLVSPEALGAAGSVQFTGTRISWIIPGILVCCSKMEQESSST